MYKRQGEPGAIEQRRGRRQQRRSQPQPVELLIDGQRPVGQRGEVALPDTLGQQQLAVGLGGQTVPRPAGGAGGTAVDTTRLAPGDIGGGGRVQQRSAGRL